MKTEIFEDKLAVYVSSRQEWRDWLQENYKKEKSVWLILFHKKSKVPTLSLDDAQEEALCFGWIDSKIKSRDHESYYVTFTPRNPKSSWSKTNKIRVGKLIEKGLMTDEGLRLIEIAISKGKWDNK